MSSCIAGWGEPGIAFLPLELLPLGNDSPVKKIINQLINEIEQTLRHAWSIAPDKRVRMKMALPQALILLIGKEYETSAVPLRGGDCRGGVAQRLERSVP